MLQNLTSAQMSVKTETSVTLNPITLINHGKSILKVDEQSRVILNEVGCGCHYPSNEIILLNWPSDRDHDRHNHEVYFQHFVALLLTSPPHSCRNGNCQLKAGHSRCFPCTCAHSREVAGSSRNAWRGKMWFRKRRTDAKDAEGHRTLLEDRLLKTASHDFGNDRMTS